MKIGVLTISYPNLSETFVIREVEALRALGHDVTVYTLRDPAGPLTPATQVPVKRWDSQTVHADSPQVLYASLGMPAHRQALALSRELGLPFLLRVWQGHDVFVHPSPEFYGQAIADPRCLGVVVEDDWMRKYARERMALSQVHVIPNGIDTSVFKPTDRAGNGGKPVILAIARFVEKKGLIPLIRAFRDLQHPTAELWLVGYGPDEQRLRNEAKGVERVVFHAPIPQDELPGWYMLADIFAAPCIQTRSGDADGIPTTALEAMASGLPVVVSELLSAPRYITHGIDGLLVPPGDVPALTAALATLVDDPEQRAKLGAAARQRALSQFAMARTSRQLEALLTVNMDARWRKGIDVIHQNRKGYTPERLAYYQRIADEALAFLCPSGHVLDIGCGDGSMRQQLNGLCHSYTGVEPEPPAGYEPDKRDPAEALSFAPFSFDTVLLYSVLQHVANPRQALAEARRVLRLGGHLALLVCIDGNPIFMNHWKKDDVLELVRLARLQIEASTLLDGRHLCVRAVKLEV